MKEKFAKVFASKTQQEWTEIFSGTYLIGSLDLRQARAIAQTPSGDFLDSRSQDFGCPIRCEELHNPFKILEYREVQKAITV